MHRVAFQKTRREKVLLDFKKRIPDGMITHVKKTNFLSSLELKRFKNTQESITCIYVSDLSSVVL